MKLDPAWREALPPSRSVASDAPVAACAFNRDGSRIGFGLGDGHGLVPRTSVCGFGFGSSRISTLMKPIAFIHAAISVLACADPSSMAVNVRSAKRPSKPYFGQVRGSTLQRVPVMTGNCW